MTAAVINLESIFEEESESFHLHLVLDHTKCMEGCRWAMILDGIGRIMDVMPKEDKIDVYLCSSSTDTLKISSEKLEREEILQMLKPLIPSDFGRRSWNSAFHLIRTSPRGLRKLDRDLVICITDGAFDYNSDALKKELQDSKDCRIEKPVVLLAVDSEQEFIDQFLDFANSSIAGRERILMNVSSSEISNYLIRIVLSMKQGHSRFGIRERMKGSSEVDSHFEDEVIELKDSSHAKLEEHSPTSSEVRPPLSPRFEKGVRLGSSKYGCECRKLRMLKLDIVKWNFVSKDQTRSYICFEHFLWFIEDAAGETLRCYDLQDDKKIPKHKFSESKAIPELWRKPDHELRCACKEDLPCACSAEIGRFKFYMCRDHQVAMIYDSKNHKDVYLAVKLTSGSRSGCRSVEEMKSITLTSPRSILS